MRINGLTSLAINKLDTLTGLKKLKIATHYVRDGKVVSDFPADIMLLEGCTPVYEEFDGWSEDITTPKPSTTCPKPRKNISKR